jgi:c-di-GMP-binding flagellar brake protein YcgR
LRAGEHISFRLRLESGAPPIEGYARVVRLAGTGHPAITFDSIKPADRERLIHFIFDSERRQRALLRDGGDEDATEPGGGQ